MGHGLSFTPEEIERYKRHLVLHQVGGPGQQKLKAASVLVIGAGGLGSAVLPYLAAAGVGRLGIIDNDRVSLSNLQRQVIHDTDYVGELKTASAARRIRALNPHVTVDEIPERLGADNALDIISGYDIVADGSDNFSTRYLVNDACYFASKPLVFAALGQFDGYLSTFRAYQTGEDGKPRPSYRCLFPEPPAPGTVRSCEEAGILGALAGVLGTLQAMEVLKELIGIGESMAGKLLIVDALGTRFETMRIPWDPANPLNGENPTIRDLSVHAQAA